MSRLPLQSVVLHCMHAGGSREGYCKGICAAARMHGWRAVVLNYRGCAGMLAIFFAGCHHMSAALPVAVPCACLDSHAHAHMRTHPALERSPLSQCIFDAKTGCWGAACRPAAHISALLQRRVHGRLPPGHRAGAGALPKGSPLCSRVLPGRAHTDQVPGRGGLRQVAGRR